MNTAVHLGVNYIVYLMLGYIGIQTTSLDIVLVLAANLIDLDHLLARPIFDPDRDSFKSHLLHKNWKPILLLCIFMLFYRPLVFLSIGIMIHYLLDILDNKLWKKKKSKKANLVS